MIDSTRGSDSKTDSMGTNPRTGSFASKSVIITGALSPVGRTIATRMIREGANVLLADGDPEVPADVSRAISKFGVARYHQFDGRVALSVNSLVDIAISSIGPPDVLIHHVGLLSTPGAPLDVSIDDWRRVIDRNLTGTFLVLQAVARSMAVRATGSIVCLISTAATVVAGREIHLDASMGAIQQLVKSAAVSLAHRGVRVNAVAMGPGSSVGVDGPASDPLSDGACRVPFGRGALPEDLEGPVMFLASSEAAYVTGITLVVDGGLLASR